MADRLRGKVAIVVGAGQTPGETIGNGRATAILLAREGAAVLCVDRDADAVHGVVVRDCEASEADPPRQADELRRVELRVRGVAGVVVQVQEHGDPLSAEGQKAFGGDRRAGSRIAARRAV